MPKYWGKQIFSLGRFPEVGQKQDREKKKGKKSRDRTMVITMTSFAMQPHLGWRTQVLPKEVIETDEEVTVNDEDVEYNECDVLALSQGDLLRKLAADANYSESVPGTRVWSRRACVRLR